VGSDVGGSVGGVVGAGVGKFLQNLMFTNGMNLGLVSS